MRPTPSRHVQAVEETLLSRILLSAERRVQTPEGAAAFMAEPNSLTTVTDALKRPASGNMYTQWAASLELKRAVGTGARLLRFCRQVQIPHNPSFPLLSPPPPLSTSSSLL